MEQVDSLRTERKFKKTEIGEIPMDWEVVKLAEANKDICYGITAKATDNPTSLRMLRTTDIKDYSVNWDDLPYCEITDRRNDIYRYLLKKDDIIIARAGTTGVSVLVKKDWDNIIFGSYLIKVKLKDNFLAKFIHYFLQSDLFWNHIISYQAGSTMKNINLPILKSLHLIAPPLPEQKKIAEILSTVDDAIEKNDEIIEKTKELKKGLMQELLTRGIGHKKFKKTKIGEIPVDWEVMKIGELCRICRGASPRPIGDKKYFGDGPGWIRIADVTNANIYLRKTKDHLSELGVSKSVRVKPGDLIMSICATIGKPVIIDMNACIHDGFVLFDKLSDQVIPLFLLYWLKKNEDYFDSRGQHGTQKNLNTRIIKKTKIPFPPPSEQRKIAKILTTIDDEIEKEEANKERLENVKKGLMQVLLTGKVRVKI